MTRAAAGLAVMVWAALSTQAAAQAPGRAPPDDGELNTYAEGRSEPAPAPCPAARPAQPGGASVFSEFSEDEPEYQAALKALGAPRADCVTAAAGAGPAPAPPPRPEAPPAGPDRGP